MGNCKLTVIIINGGRDEKMMKKQVRRWLEPQMMGARRGEMMSHIFWSVAQAAGPCRGEGSYQPFLSTAGGAQALPAPDSREVFPCLAASPPGSFLRWAPESGVLWHLQLAFLCKQWFWEYRRLRLTGLGINPSVPQTLPCAGLWLLGT